MCVGGWVQYLGVGLGLGLGREVERKRKKGGKLNNT